MKKLIALLLALSCIVLAFAGCAKPAENTPAPDEEQTANELVVATSPDFPPFENLQSDGSIVGIEVDVLQLICDKLGMTLKLESMDFDSVLPGVQAGKYDVGMSGISVTEERQKNVLFTDPYCLAAQAIVVTKDSPITGKADLEGLSVSVQSGTTAETFCLANGYDVHSYAANNDAESALVAGKVQAWVIDDLTAADMVKTYNAANGEDALVILPDAMTTEPYAFALAFGNEALCEQINAALNELLADGTIADVFAAYDVPYTSPIEE